MAEASDDNGDASWYRRSYSSHAGSPSIRLPPPRASPTPRFGYDYRRPVMLSPENTVIDLTEDADSPPQRVSAPVAHHTYRPTLRFPRDIMNRDSAEQTPVIDLEAEDNDVAEAPSSSADVEIVGSSTVRPNPMEPRYFDSNGFSMYYPPPARPRARESGHGRRNIPSGIPGSGFGQDFLTFMNSMPAVLPYNVPAFEYVSSTQTPPRPPRNRYHAPSPAPPGFARCLEDENVPVCPNCDEELGTGSGRKLEIYIAKPCGHVSIGSLFP
jgi:hypothetical protein